METSELWQKELFEDHKTGKHLRYLSHVAAGEERLPLILYIHGAGSRGDSLDGLGHVGPIGELDRGRPIAAHIVAPQCHADTWFELFETLLDFVRQQAARPDVDPDRVYLCGSSMGGYTSWQLAMSCPELFAALVPVCGGGMYWNAGRLKEMPIWAFHGARDRVVLPEESLHMVRAVNDCGGHARLTILPRAEHNAWDAAFSSEELWDWLFQQRKTR